MDGLKQIIEGMGGLKQRIEGVSEVALFLSIGIQAAIPLFERQVKFSIEEVQFSAHQWITVGNHALCNLD